MFNGGVPLYVELYPDPRLDVTTLTRDQYQLEMSPTFGLQIRGAAMRSRFGLA